METRMKIWMIVGERMVGCRKRMAIVFGRTVFVWFSSVKKMDECGRG